MTNTSYDEVISQLERRVYMSGLEGTGTIEPKKVGAKKKISDVIIPEELSADCPILISAPTGKGKSTFITNILAKYAADNEKTVLFVSSRVAINMQQKKALAKAVGEATLLDELTCVGWRARETIGGVTVITYHRLFALMKGPEEEKKLRKFDYFVFDEVHALYSDALFTSCTGELLDRIRDVFCDSVRIYMSATPDSIKDVIAQKEFRKTLTVYTWKNDFSWVKPYFFSDSAQIAERINADKSIDKWLVFIESIDEGARFSERLKVPFRQVNAKSREANPEQWATLLDNETFEPKVLISTNVLDCGVNFKDSNLRKIVSLSHHKDEIIQQLGRKRRNKSDVVELYLFDVPLTEIRRRKSFVAKELKALELNSRGAAFLDRYIYGEELPQVRKFFSISTYGHAELNPLAKSHLEDDYELLSILEKAAVKNGGYGFSQYICKALGQKVPTGPAQWLDGRKNGVNEQLFNKFIQNNLEKPISEEAHDAFSKEFRSLYSATFGKDKNDRLDRMWQSTAIRNRLESLNWGYTLKVEDSIWEIIKNGGKY